MDDKGFVIESKKNAWPSAHSSMWKFVLIEVCRDDGLVQFDGNDGRKVRKGISKTRTIF